MEATLKRCEKQGWYAACICDRSFHLCYEHAKKHIKMACGIHKLIIVHKNNQYSEKCKFVIECKNEIQESKNLRNVKSDQMLAEINKDQNFLQKLLIICLNFLQKVLIVCMLRIIIN